MSPGLLAQASAADVLGELALQSAMESYLDSVTAGDTKQAREQLNRIGFWHRHRSPEQVARLERALGIST